MKWNESGRQKLGGQKPCQQVQRATLYSDLLQAYTGGKELGTWPSESAAFSGAEREKSQGLDQVKVPRLQEL